MRRAVLTASLAPLLLLAGCGGVTKYASVSDLQTALQKAGVECPEFTQVKPSGHSAGHGSCARDGKTFLGLDVYKSTSDRDAEVKETADLLKQSGISFCIVYADQWSVNATSSLDECTAAEKGLGGKVMQG